MPLLCHNEGGATDRIRPGDLDGQGKQYGQPWRKTLKDQARDHGIRTRI